MNQAQAAALMQVIERMVVAISIVGPNAVPGARHMDLLRDSVEQLKVELERGDR